jgi:protease I
LSNASPFKGKKIAIMVASGFNEEQFLIIQKTLLAAEASYTIISRDIGTTNGWASNEWGLSYPVDQSLSETLAIDYDALVVPGGSHQIDTLSNDLHARRILRAFLRENDPVALAGVSTMLLTTIDAAKDRKVAASDADSALLIAAGAEIIDQPTVRDKNLISATSGEAGISVLLDMLAQAIQENKSN